MKSKNEMTLQKVTRTNSCQHAINLRSSPFTTLHLTTGLRTDPILRSVPQTRLLCLSKTLCTCERTTHWEGFQARRPTWKKCWGAWVSSATLRTHSSAQMTTCNLHRWRTEVQVRKRRYTTCVQWLFLILSLLYI